MIKQVIVIRKDLKMRRGKEIAQGSHASMAFLTQAIYDTVNKDSGSVAYMLSEVEKQWLDSGMTKICVVVNSEQELIEIAQKAKSLKIKSHLVWDLGRTEFGGVTTATACAIGPDLSENIDPITSHLDLY